ncbi:MAG: hypothetical protein JW993_13835 [Sedimentisphaerales bacterium]|nr:hypothetical protein [Sedimentisphaerales bacterium]
MRSAKDIERSFRRADLDIEVDVKRDYEIARDLADLHRRSRPCGTSALGSVPRRMRLGYLALAAVVLVALVTAVLVSRRGSSGSRDVAPPAAPMSAAEMLTVGRLKAVYRQGGPDALEAHCEEAAEKVDGKPKEVSIKDLIVELEGR